MVTISSAISKCTTTRCKVDTVLGHAIKMIREK